MRDYLTALINVIISVHAYVRYIRFIRLATQKPTKSVIHGNNYVFMNADYKFPSPTTHCRFTPPPRGTPANIHKTPIRYF